MEIVGRSKIGPHLSAISQKQQKAISVEDAYALVDLSAISPSEWKNLTFIERLLRDHWEIDEIMEYSLKSS